MKLWHGEHTVRLQHLKSYDYLPAECEQMQMICDACGGLRLRVSRVYSDSLFGDSQKSVAVVGEAESTLFEGCGREIVECVGIGI